MIPKLPTQERRFLSSSVELRAVDPNKTDETGRTIRGYAAKFNSRSENMGDADCQFYEVILPGAFDDVLNDDVRALFNHEAELILARSKGGKGTLQIGVDEIGLWYEFDAPNTACGNDLLESIKRGDIDQSSFSFQIAKDGQSWTESQVGDGPEIFLRTISKISRLYDVSPVTYPAYPDTEAASRSLSEFRKASEQPPAPTYNTELCPRQRHFSSISKPAN